MGLERGSKASVVTEIKDLASGTDFLKVSNSGVVLVQSFVDNPDGKLHIAEVGKNLPLDVKRAYWINGLANPDAVRGKHAHRDLKQVIFCINGLFKLDLDDGRNQQTIIMDMPGVGIVLDKLLWHEMRDFSPNCVILVLANDHYNEADYVRDYDEFLDLARAQHKLILS